MRAAQAFGEFGLRQRRWRNEIEIGRKVGEQRGHAVRIGGLGHCINIHA